MASTCVAPIKARVARIVKLDTCGNPVTGAGSVVTTKGFIQIEVEPEYEEGTEYLQRNANDELCVNEKSPNTLKRVNLSIDFCEIDPDAIVLLTGERLLQATGGGPVTGTGVAFGEGQLTNRFSLEVWQPVAGSGGCAGGVERFVYWAFPNVGNTQVGDFTLENASLTLTIEADTKGAALSWGDGPGTGPSWIPGTTVDVTEHFLFNIIALAPPTPVCGATSLT
jgi:hypothetical protein